MGNRYTAVGLLKSRNHVQNACIVLHRHAKSAGITNLRSTGFSTINTTVELTGTKLAHQARVAGARGIS